MKRAYQRPIVCFQNFALSNQVSSGCEGIATSGEFQCAVYIPDIDDYIFNSENICAAIPPGGDDSICYMAPSEENNVYSS